MTPKTAVTVGHSLMKFKIPIFFLLILLVLASVAYLLWQQLLLPADPAGTNQIFVVKKGENITSISNRLEEAGLIKNRIAFKLLLYRMGITNKIQAGDFRLSASMPSRQLADQLTHGAIDVWVTLPEGLRREEIGLLIVKALPDFDYDLFLELTAVKEGQLFPDTYLFPKDIAPETVVKILTDTFTAKFNPDMTAQSAQIGLTPDEVVTLASIIEREAKHSPDRAIVAGILLKRLSAGWPLQVDATIQYALGRPENWWPVVVKADLAVKSPYNTYLNKDLPPAPICNPGLDSIKAVLSPTTSPYWYYLSDPSGGMHYAESDEGHAANIRQYLR